MSSSLCLFPHQVLGAVYLAVALGCSIDSGPENIVDERESAERAEPSTSAPRGGSSSSSSSSNRPSSTPERPSTPATSSGAAEGEGAEGEGAEGAGGEGAEGESSETPAETVDAETPVNMTPPTGGTGTLPPISPDALLRGDAPTVGSATQPGPFSVSTLDAELRDSPDYGTQTLHVPEGAEPPFAGVAIVPGLGEEESSIAAWGPFLASHGIVTLTIGTNGTEDSVEERANALLDALETIKAEDTRAGSPLEGKVAADRLAIMGWSMGGGATLVASSRTPSLRAAITLAAWNDGGSFGSERVPTLLLAGSADDAAGGQSQEFFESIPATTPKMLFEVDGGSHTIANSPSGAGGAVGRFGLSWLKVFLEGDERYRPLLLDEPSEASDFRENLSAL